MDKELQKQEAIKRMKMLKILNQTIKEFENENVVNVSEHGGILFWLNEEQKQYVKEFENKSNAVVYHVIHNHTEFGELLSFLYVSKDEDEWDYDKNDLKYGTAIAYVKNLDDDSCSEFGSIGIKPQFGGLVRVS